MGIFKWLGLEKDIIKEAPEYKEKVYCSECQYCFTPHNRSKEFALCRGKRDGIEIPGDFYNRPIIEGRAFYCMEKNRNNDCLEFIPK